MPEQQSGAQCPWEMPLTALCPKHGVPLRYCPATVTTWPTMALDRIVPEAASGGSDG